MSADRAFVQHYQEPFLAFPAGDEDDPRPWMVQTLRSGDAEMVIGRLDAPSKADREIDPRALLHLAGAHYQIGSCERAMVLAEKARRYFRRLGNAVAQATAIAQLARGEWRRKGLDAALKMNSHALAIDPRCKTSRANNLCYISLRERSDLASTHLSELLAVEPDFERDEFYLDFFLTDAQLSWLRHQASFQPIAARVRAAVAVHN